MTFKTFATYNKYKTSESLGSTTSSKGYLSKRNLLAIHLFVEGAKGKVAFKMVYLSIVARYW